MNIKQYPYVFVIGMNARRKMNHSHNDLWVVYSLGFMYGKVTRWIKKRTIK